MNLLAYTCPKCRKILQVNSENPIARIEAMRALRRFHMRTYHPTIAAELWQRVKAWWRK